MVKEKERILAQLINALKKIEEIEFSYVYGSFPSTPSFKDIAIYTSNEKDNPLKFELEIEVKLYRKINLPVDIRLLNKAPNPFCFHGIKEGKLLFSRNENKRRELEKRVLYNYFDFSPFRIRYLREVIGLKYAQDKLLKLSEIRKVLKNLDSLASMPKEDILRDVLRISSAKYNFIVAIEGVIDICNLLIPQNKLRVPEDYADTFEVLEEASAIDKGFSETMIKMVRFRNRVPDKAGREPIKVPHITNAEV